MQKQFKLKTFMSQKTEKPHFYILNKGLNSGKPMHTHCPNCFVLSTQTEKDKEFFYWLLFGLWKTKAFYIYLRGSVIPFIILGELKKVILQASEKALANPTRFNKSITLLHQLDTLEKQYQKNLQLIKQARTMVFYKYHLPRGSISIPKFRAIFLVASKNCLFYHKKNIMKTLISLVLLISSSTILFAQKTGTFTDSRDGKTYKTVKIGNQTWMAENLAFKVDSGCWAYNNDVENVNKYGYLYDWRIAMSICPKDWNIPSKEDFETLLVYVGNNDRERYSALKFGGESGFSALPGGYYETAFLCADECAIFWSSSTFFDVERMALRLYSSFGRAGMGSYSEAYSLSVRCLKD